MPWVSSSLVGRGAVRFATRALVRARISVRFALRKLFIAILLHPSSRGRPCGPGMLVPWRAPRGQQAARSREHVIHRGLALRSARLHAAAESNANSLLRQG